MAEIIYDWIIDIPIAVAEFGKWLTTDLKILGVTPLSLLGIGGASVIITIIGVHIVKLFI